MNIYVVNEWVKALNQYTLTRSDYLRTDKGFNPFGVLCDLHAKYYGYSWVQSLTGKWQYMGETKSPPNEVIEWAGVEDCVLTLQALSMNSGLAVHHLQNLLDQYTAVRWVSGGY